MGVSCCQFCMSLYRRVANICKLFQIYCLFNALSLSVPITMDFTRVPSPAPSDGSFAKPFEFVASHSLAGSLPGTTQSSAASHSVGPHQRQMVRILLIWFSTSTANAR
jgi:hypothetical protein